MSAHDICTNLRMTIIRMPRAMFMLLLAAIVLGATPAHAQTTDPSQGDGRVSAYYSWQDAIPQPGRLLRQEPLDPALGLSNAGTQVRILYSSTNGIDGKSAVAVSGLLFLPRGTPPAGGWPLMAWGHETAGMADICAPSWVGYSIRVGKFLNAWLAKGIAIVATDYQGLGTPGPHPYMAVRPGAVFMGIGERDSDAPSRLQLSLAKEACAAGTIVEAHLYAGMTHDAAVTMSLPSAMQFADKVLAGKPVTPVCTPDAE